MSRETNVTGIKLLQNSNMSHPISKYILFTDTLTPKEMNNLTRVEPSFASDIVTL